MARKTKKPAATHVERAVILGLVGVWLVVIAIWMESTSADAAANAGIFGLFGFIFGMVAFVWLLLSAVKR